MEVSEGSILTFKDRKFWLSQPVPCSYATKYKKKKISVKVAAKLRQYADREATKILNRILVRQYSLPLMPQLSFLDEHQKEGVKWILSRSRSYIAHAPGAGKTAQAIMASILCKGPGQVLFIVPPTLTINWVREIKKFTELLALDLDVGHKFFNAHRMTTAIVPKSIDKLNMNWQASFIICPDSMLTKNWVLKKLIKMDKRFVAVDEASRFKEPYAQRTIALFGGSTSDFTSPGLIYDARYTTLLDGSPMPNRPIELWAPTISMAPEIIDFMSYDNFGFRYCGAKQTDEGKWEFKGSCREEELKARLQKSFMHVVTEENLNHPERLRSILYMDQDPRTPKEKAFEARVVNKLNFQKLDEEKSQGEIASARKTLGLSKVKWTAKYVEERLERKNESILLLAWHRDACEGLSSLLKKWRPALIIGGTKEHYREKAFKSFQKGKCKLIIGNIATLGRGHNLQRADRVIFAEYSWSDELNKQCEKRASRRGRDRSLPVRCEYIAVLDSMDEKILNSLLRKAKTVRKVIG